MATASRSEQAELNIDFNGNEAQGAFVRDENKESAYIGGVGSGKTVAGLMRLARHIFEWNPGEQIAVVAPTVPMLRNVIIPEMRQWDLLGQSGIEYKRSENLIEYPNDTTVILESANNERKIQRLEGLNLAAAWLDEVAQHNQRTYHVLGDRLRTGNYRNLFATGTPKGFNWVYREFVDELEGVHEESVADGTRIRNEHTTTIYGVSTATNEANPDDYIEARKRQHSGQSYKQEVEGEFVQFEGLVHPWFGEEHRVDSPPETYSKTIYGVDWGFSNPAVVLVLVKSGDEWVVVDEVYESRLTDEDHAEKALELQERWGPGVFYCDPSEPANIETFKRKGLDARKAKNDVTPGIQHVTAQRDNLQVVDSCQSVINEFGLYQYKDDGDSDDPIEQNDHAMDALRYAIFTHMMTEPKADPFPFQ